MIPRGLFRITALLLKHSIVHIEDIWAYLGQQLSGEKDEIINL